MNKLTEAIEREKPYIPTYDYEVGYNNGLTMAQSIAITLDVVPVVRCKDCKCNGECSIQDAMNWTPRTEIGDWFCSYGERREGE